ncbi:MAG: VanZ family protein [Acidobacteriota bacterium]|nr:VanZ family protein [Acidobacteriota bacterium]
MSKPTPERNISKANSSIPQRLWRYGPLLLWMMFISILSTAEFSSIDTSRFICPLLLWLFPDLSESRLAAIHFLTRKAGHITEYAILAFLARRAFVTSSKAFIHRRWFELGLLLIVCYALLDEFHQSFVPSRTASIYDSAIDVVGGLTVLLIFKLYDKRVRTWEGGTHVAGN